MPRKYEYNDRDTAWRYYEVEYTSEYTEEMDTEGLKVLKWSMFDSPEKLGSGKMFMESAPVFILDEVMRKERLRGRIQLGYTSKVYADRIKLPSKSAHRLGMAVKFRCINTNARMRFVKGLIQYGVERITLSEDSIYFDTDNYINKAELKIL